MKTTFFFERKFSNGKTNPTLLLAICTEFERLSCSQCEGQAGSLRLLRMSDRLLWFVLETASQGRTWPCWLNSSCCPLCTWCSHTGWHLAAPHPWWPPPTTSLWRRRGRWRRRSPTAPDRQRVLTRRSWTRPPKQSSSLEGKPSWTQTPNGFFHLHQCGSTSAGQPSAYLWRSWLPKSHMTTIR